MSRLQRMVTIRFTVFVHVSLSMYVIDYISNNISFRTIKGTIVKHISVVERVERYLTFFCPDWSLGSQAVTTHQHMRVLENWIMKCCRVTHISDEAC